MVGENLPISKMAKNALKRSTVVGENFEIHTSEVDKMHFPPRLEKILI